ncbi:hypothetical protein Tco_0195432 [Tanacetum coccineum]
MSVMENARTKLETEVDWPRGRLSFSPTYFLRVYNANTLAEMVVAKKSLQNWLTYYTNKLERKNKRKTVKVFGQASSTWHIDRVKLQNIKAENMGRGDRSGVGQSSLKNLFGSEYEPQPSKGCCV